MIEAGLEFVAGLIRQIFYDIIWFTIKKVARGIRMLAWLAIDAVADWWNARRLRRDKLKKEAMGKAGNVLGIQHPDKR